MREHYETRKEAIEDFNYYLESWGIEPASESDLIDWIQGSETYAQIKELARDYANEVATERLETKNAWRYEH